MAKVRVYEVAKEYGLESKVVMAELAGLGEFVRSASSTIEASVLRKLTDALAPGPAGATQVQDLARELGVDTQAVLRQIRAFGATNVQAVNHPLSAPLEKRLRRTFLENRLLPVPPPGVHAVSKPPPPYGWGPFRFSGHMPVPKPRKEVEAVREWDPTSRWKPLRFIDPKCVGPYILRKVTAASDVCSLGALLVFAATGHTPYPGSNPLQTMFRVVSEEPDLTGLPSGISGVVASCLRKDPGQRPGLGELLDRVSRDMRPGADGMYRASELLPRKAFEYLRFHEV